MLLNSLFLRNPTCVGILTLTLPFLVSVLVPVSVSVSVSVGGGLRCVGGSAELLNVLKNKEELPRILGNNTLCRIVVVLSGFRAHT